MIAPLLFRTPRQKPTTELHTLLRTAMIFLENTEASIWPLVLCEYIHTVCSSSLLYTTKYIRQLLETYRLCQEQVHAGAECLLLCIGASESSQCYNCGRFQSFLLLKRSDCSRGFESVELWHVDVHEDHLRLYRRFALGDITARFHFLFGFQSRLLVRIDGLLAISRHDLSMSELLCICDKQLKVDGLG